MVDQNAKSAFIKYETRYSAVFSDANYESASEFQTFEMVDSIR